MKNLAVRNLVYAQLSFFGFVLLSFIIQPQGLRLNDGLSYWGTHFPGVITYGWAIILSSFFMWQASNYLPNSDPRMQWTRLALRAVVVFLPLIVLTPYTINKLFYGSHVAVSSAAFAIQFVLSIYLTLTMRRDWLNVFLVLIETASGLIALFSLPDYLLLETPGQLAFQLAFGILIIRTLSLKDLQKIS